MEFIKIGKNYLIKNSNGRVVSEKEKLQLENNELILEDIKSPCAKEITKKISKNKKRIKEIEQEEKGIITNVSFSEERLEPKAIVKLVKETALQDKENADGTIEETISAD